jgi:hypothetical protein
MRRLLAIIFVLSVNHAGGQVALRARTPQPAATPVPPSYRSPTELKKLPLEQLVDVQITSAARRPEPLSQAASAVDVITDEDIHRAGVTNLPDAFRLAPPMEVAQTDGHDWAISTRGFNIPAANKLQVLMDGRSLYTPLSSGVFWDVQQTFFARRRPDRDLRSSTQCLRHLAMEFLSRLRSVLGLLFTLALTAEQNRVRPRINSTALRNARLNVSSKLLQVADIRS